MPKFYGEIGYSDGGTVEDPEGSGIWVDVLVEQSYFGEIIRDSHKYEEGDGLNSNGLLSNQISILADKNLIQNFRLIKYLKWDGVFWSISSVEVRAPRLLLSLGDIYNGKKAEVV